jgi:hypothetical protein
VSDTVEYLLPPGMTEADLLRSVLRMVLEAVTKAAS